MIYKAFVIPYLDYGDILYDQAYNMSFHHKLESIQYNACLAITGAIRGISKEKRYQELPRTRFRITSVTTLVQKTRNVLQNLRKQKPPLSF